MIASVVSRSLTILRGVLYAALFVWLWGWLVISARALDAGIPMSLPHWLRPIGFGLVAAGALLAGACIATFVTRDRGTPAPFDPPREFVGSGLYRLVRNPMYVDATAVIFGGGLVLSSPSVVLLAFAFVAVVHLFVVLYEEPALARRFGAPYREYRASVHRRLIWKPGAGSSR